MYGETSLFGVAVPTILVLALVAFLLNVGLKRLVGAFGLYRFVWHPALFDVALFVIVLSSVASFSQWVQS